MPKEREPRAYKDHEWQRRKLGKVQAGVPKMKKFTPYQMGLLFSTEPPPRGKIMGRFRYPPFSVLNAREGDWQKRKRAWLALGIRSELGRFEELTWQGDQINSHNLNFYRDKNSGKKNKVSPGGSPRPAADYGKTHARGDGAGRPIGENGAAYTDIGQRVAQYRRKQSINGGLAVDGQRYGRKKKAFGTTDEQKRYKANSACRPHSGHDPRPGRPRGEEYTGGDAWVQSGDSGQTGTSIFDPVLTELSYLWFCPPGGMVLDPFAGGSVRGIVAAKMGRSYTGIELRPEQLESNMTQAAAIVGDSGPLPVWLAGDALRCRKLVSPDFAADFIFSCPPYGNLEIYSDDPRDLSQMEYPQFLETYRKIILRSCKLLKNNRFACFVVGDFRSQTGCYQNFVSDTIAAFHDAGLGLYNQMILVTAVGSLPIRIQGQFTKNRKIGMTHQQVLVFCKGDWKKAGKRCEKL